MIAIAVYNLCGDNSILYWRVHYFFFMNLVLVFAFWELQRKEVYSIVRKIYISGFVFSILYTFFQIFTLISKDISVYLGKINSVLWSSVSVGIVILLLIFILHDKTK
jgi:hypothetical protein